MRKQLILLRNSISENILFNNKMNYKNIHIGQMMRERVAESGIEISRICSFLQNSELEIEKMYESENLSTDVLLKWSKLLEYDFFRLYSQHLILYAPSSKEENSKLKKTGLPKFRKNIYTREVIDFILDKIQSGKMTKTEVINRYKIPKTTLYKWISKYHNL